MSPVLQKTVSSDLPAIAGGTPIRLLDQPLLFGAPLIGEEEIDAVTACLRSGWIGQGKKVEQFEREFALYKGVQGAIAVSSGTSALQLAFLAIGLRPGDEVIAPSMTFPPSLQAISHAGGIPVLADCRKDTFNSDPQSIERALTPNTRAILVVHMGGLCCDMDPVLSLARRHNIRVVEDCAHAIEARYRNSLSGTIGDIGCFSFYPTKNLTTGDGGMVISRHGALLSRMRLISQQGMTAGAWDRFQSGNGMYSVVAPGLKCGMNDIAASLGLVQLSRLDARANRRRRVWENYQQALRGLPIILPVIPEGYYHACHLFSVLLDLDSVAVSRDEVVAAMRAENIGVGVHYVPAHEQPYYRQAFGLLRENFPNASFIGERTVSLPLSSELTIDDVSEVSAALARILRYFSADGQLSCQSAVGALGR
jgi:dTDP-4-amino-4,6-dideoxygalactose transaminase